MKIKLNKVQAEDHSNNIIDKKKERKKEIIKKQVNIAALVQDIHL